MLSIPSDMCQSNVLVHILSSALHNLVRVFKCQTFCSSLASHQTIYTQVRSSLDVFGC